MRRLIQKLTEWFFTVVNVGSRNPVLVISFTAMIIHRSLFWAVTFVGAVGLHFAVQITIESTISIRNLKEATKEFLDVGAGFDLKSVDDTAFFNAKDFAHILDNRRRLRRIFGEASFAEAQDDQPWIFKAHPLRVFIASKNAGGIIGGAKAYLNTRGPSLVFLAKQPNLLNATQRFVLMHELEHVSGNGAVQLIFGYGCWIWGVVGILFICSVASSWIHWVGVTVYSAEWLLKCFFLMPIMREVYADNGSLLRLANADERRMVANDLLELFRDHKLALRPVSPNPKIPPFMKYSKLGFRIRYLEGFLKRLSPEGAPPLYSSQMTALRFAIPYFLFFVHLAFVTRQPSALGLVVLLTSLAVFTVAAYHVSIRAIPVQRYVNDYLGQYASPTVSANGVAANKS